MKKITFVAMTAMVLASGVMAAGEKFKICNYSDDDVPLSYHNSIIIKSIVEQNLEPQFGNLENIPLNVSSQKGATTLKVSWSSFLFQLNQKIINSSDPAAEITYLNLPFAKYQINAVTAEDASSEMIKDLLKSNKFLGLLIDLNSNNCNAHGHGHGLESPWAIQRMINASQQLKGVGVNAYIIYLKNYLEKNINTSSEIAKYNKGKVQATVKRVEEIALEDKKIAAEKKFEQEAMEKSRVEAEAAYRVNLPQLKESMLAMRKDTQTLSCTKESGWPGNMYPKNDLYNCKRDQYETCYRPVEIRGTPYVFAFHLEKALFGGYRPKIYKGALVSQCRTKEEETIRYDLHFGQYKHLSIVERNQIVRAQTYPVPNEEYKKVEANWELMHPVWGANTLSPSDVEYAAQQIENEMKKDEK